MPFAFYIHAYVSKITEGSRVFLDWLEPSPQDKSFTTKAVKDLDIEVCDHIIVSEDGF